MYIGKHCTLFAHRYYFLHVESKSFVVACYWRQMSFNMFLQKYMPVDQLVGSV